MQRPYCTILGGKCDQCGGSSSCNLSSRLTQPKILNLASTSGGVCSHASCGRFHCASMLRANHTVEAGSKPTCLHMAGDRRPDYFYKWEPAGAAAMCPITKVRFGISIFYLNSCYALINSSLRSSAEISTSL